MLVLENGLVEKEHVQSRSEEEEELSNWEERIRVANRNWERAYPDTNDVPFERQTATKVVRFPSDGSLVQKKQMVVWSFAHQTARRGPWEQFGRDSERFARRISTVSEIISPVLLSRTFPPRWVNEDTI